MLTRLSMIRIAITLAAFGRHRRDPAQGFHGSGRPDGKSGYLVALDRHVVERLACLPKSRSRSQASVG